MVNCWSGAAHVFGGWPNTEIVTISRGRYSTVKRLFSEHVLVPRSARGADVLFSPGNYAVPLAHGIPQVATVHDLQHVALPQHFSRAVRGYRTAMFAANVRCCTRIITMSEFTRQGLIREFGARPEKVTVVPLGCELEIAPEIAPRAQLTLPAVYVFYPAATWVHKNHGIAIAAVERARGTGVDVHLVLSGARGGSLPTLPTPLPPFVHDLGHLSQNDLREVMTRAKALVFPSLFEGFGIPLLEAMRLGVPVIASRAASIPEVVGAAGVLLDPGDVASWADAIAAACSDPNWAAPFVARGAEHVARYSWDSCAASTLSVLEDAARGR
jgi:glycosyltransferase involved in cell wall biosynthesis